MKNVLLALLVHICAACCCFVNVLLLEWTFIKPYVNFRRLSRTSMNSLKETIFNANLATIIPSTFDIILSPHLQSSVPDEDNLEGSLLLSTI